MKMKDSSEIQEAAKLFDQLIAQSGVVAAVKTAQRPAPRALSGGRQSAAAPAGKRKPAARQPVIEAQDSTDMYRGDRLENMLYAMCKRGGFDGALLVDSGGLPLAVYNSPVKDEAIAAAFATTLGDAIGKASKLLKQQEANNISMDINYTDKAVVRRFLINDLPYFLMAVCPQDLDERAEIELSIDQITTLLKKKS